MTRSRLLAVVLAVAIVASLVSGPAIARSPDRRRVDARTGMLEVPIDELAAAVRKKDEVEIARAAERIGIARLGEALIESDGATLAAALRGVAIVPGGVRLLGPVTDLIGTGEPATALPALRTLGELLATTSPPELDDWEVPPDVVSRTCVALRAIALGATYPTNVRLAAIDALADAIHVCTATVELASLLRDPTPAVRRSAALVIRPAERVATGGFPVGLRDIDKSVASASAASMCEILSLPVMVGRGGSREPVWDNARETARRLVVAAETSPEDAVQMLDCLDPTSTSDRQLLERVKAGRAAAPVRERAGEILSGNLNGSVNGKSDGTRPPARP